MNKKRTKIFVPLLYILTIGVFGTSLYLGQKLFNRDKFNDDIIYVDSEIFTDNIYIPVVNTSVSIIRPYFDEAVYISKSFYNYKDEASNQENAIIYYEGTYMQNSGVDYKFSSTFDIVSILDGRVIEVSENDILGKTVKVEHENNLISVYQCLGNVSVNKDDIVLRGQVIGTSGTSSLYSKDFNLHFELFKDGVNVNPEEYYNKSIDEL